MKAIIVYGSIDDGFNFHGPFESAYEALKYSEAVGDPGWVVNLHEPSREVMATLQPKLTRPENWDIWLNVRKLQYARGLVKDAIRRKGERISQYPARYITTAAKELIKVNGW